VPDKAQLHATLVLTVAQITCIKRLVRSMDIEAAIRFSVTAYLA
jgi:hypothetical protein